MPDDDDLARALAQAVWAADFIKGDMVTPWNHLGDVGQAAYLSDATHLLKTAPKCGVRITLKENR